MNSLSCASPAGRWRATLLLCLLVAAAWLALADKYAQTPREIFLGFVVGLLVCLDVENWRQWRVLLRRLSTTLALGIAVLAAAEITRKLVDRPEISRREALAWMVEFHGYALLFAALWLYSPLLLASGGHLVRWRDPIGPLFWISTALVVFSGWSFATALASVSPEISFRYFGREIGVYAPLALIWLRWALSDYRLRHLLRRWGAIVLAAGSLAGAMVGTVYIVGPPPVQARMEQPLLEHSDVILRQADANAPGEVAWRLSFPFGHHNRMSYFAVLAALGLSMAAVTRRSRAGTLACSLTVAAALVCLGMTLNRGAMLALAAGVAAAGLLALGWRRGRWLLLALPIVIPLAVVALPAMQEERLRSLINPASYTDPGSTISARFRHWRAAGWMINQNPVTGIGYGWRNFENHYEHVVADQLGFGADAEAVHAHNVWLQIAAESGWPGALLWLAFCALRWWLLAEAWENRRHLSPTRKRILVLWTALEVSIQIYSLGNLPLRRSLGVLTWGIWLAMLSDLLVWRNDCRRELNYAPEPLKACSGTGAA